MNKVDRRKLIKQVYPAAVAGDRAALRLLAVLAKRRMPLGNCEVCGVLVIGKRCMAHLRRRVSMREKVSLTA